MATEITTVKSSNVNIDTASGRIITWTSSAGTKQSHYEIQYRLKTNSSWSTLGKIASSATQFDLIGIYNKIQKEFTEVYYRVVVYWVNTTADGSVYHYQDYSPAYHLVFSHSYSSTMGENNGQIEVYPLFDSLSNDQIYFFNVQVDENTTKKVLLVDQDNPMAGSREFVWHTGERKHLAHTKFNVYQTNISAMIYAQVYQKRYGTDYGYKSYENYQNEKIEYANYTPYYAGSSVASYRYQDDPYWNSAQASYYRYGGITARMEGN